VLRLFLVLRLLFFLFRCVLLVCLVFSLSLALSSSGMRPQPTASGLRPEDEEQQTAAATAQPPDKIINAQNSRNEVTLT